MREIFANDIGGFPCFQTWQDLGRASAYCQDISVEFHLSVGGAAIAFMGTTVHLIQFFYGKYGCIYDEFR